MHTPGPWKVDLDQAFTLGGDVVSVEAISADGKYVTREICTCMLDTDSHPDGADWKEDAANARLIAAAPELLAKLDNLCHEAQGYLRDLASHKVDATTLIGAIKQAKAALAKAGT